MQFTLLASAFALAATVVASPSSYGEKCVTQKQADHIVSQVIDIFGHFPNVNAANKTAQALLSSDFTEYSDSILSLQSRPLTGDGLTADKAEWIAGIVGRPGIDGIETLYTSPAGCHEVVWFFSFNNLAAATYRVRGFNLITLNSKNTQIKKLELEFNSIAWGLDDGELPCNFTAKA
ncbi:hypothetical protein LTS10_004060 [Elasticomyces elasticus]|nr:hypothetical protein LTS10_004060 [Elasticomyces elasticus]